MNIKRYFVISALSILLIGGCAWDDANRVTDSFNLHLDSMQSDIDLYLAENIISERDAEIVTAVIDDLKTSVNTVDSALPDEGEINLESIAIAAVPLLPFPWNVIAIGVGSLATAAAVKKVIG